MAYGEIDFTLEPGVRFDRSFQSLIDPDDASFDITGFTPRMRAFNSGQLWLSSEGDTPSILIDYQPDGETDTFYVTIMGDVTAQLYDPIGGTGNLDYFIDLVDALVPESTIRLLKGRLLIDRSGGPNTP